MSEIHKTQDLGEEKLAKLLWRFAVPAIIGLMISSLYYIIDRIFVGNGVGAVGLGAISVAYPLTIVQLAVGLMVGVGGSVNFSVRLGQKKTAVAERFLNASFSFILIVGTLMTVVAGLFLEKILIFLGATETLLPYAKTYVGICLLSAPFYMGGMMLNSFIRACGSPRYAMGSMLIGAVLNMILDPLFIFVFDKGIAGAAIATVMAQTVSFAWGVSYFFFNGSFCFKKKYLFPTVGIITAVCSTGMAQFVIQTIGCFVQTFLNRSLSFYGNDIALSASSVSTSMVLFLLMPVLGICEGAQPITGYNLGAKKYQRVLDMYKMTCVITSVICFISWILLYSFARQIAGMFAGNDADLIHVTVMALQICSMALPTLGLQISTSLFLQATKKPKTAMLLLLSRQLIVLVPLLYVLPRFFGIKGVFWALPLSDFAAFFFSLVLMLGQIKLYRQKAYGLLFEKKYK